MKVWLIYKKINKLLVFDLIFFYLDESYIWMEINLKKFIGILRYGG